MNRRPALAPDSPLLRPEAAPEIPNRLKLFGGGALESASGPVAGRAAQRHRIALLALLATTRRIHRSRDQLIAFLWPDADAERGRKLLSDSIYRVNRALGGDAITGSGDDLRLNRNQLSCDVADFEAAVDAQDWRRAVAAYGGPLLDGFYLPDASEFDQWLEGERAQYARTACRAIEQLADEAAHDGRTAEAAEWWHRLAALTPDDSRVAVEVMRALEAAGNRAGAIRHARAHAAYLRAELGIEPDRAVQELLEQLTSRVDAAPVVTTPLTPTDRAIAVLPFDGAADASQTSWFADGVSEELMSFLTRMPGLRVASRTSSFACRSLKLDIREVARRLCVDYVLEGSVRRAGDRIRISAQLTDARSGYQLWFESFDRHVTDLLAIQTEIAGAIAARIEPSLFGQAAALFGPSDPASLDPELRDLYFQARFQLHRRTAESLHLAADLFERTIAREPASARAWAGLAETQAVRACYDYLAPRTAFPAAEAAARHARRLDPSLASPHAVLASVDGYFHWNWEAAEEGFRRAIALQPSSSTVHHWYGDLLASRGRIGEAERELQRAAELDPLAMIVHAAHGWLLVQANEPERALQSLESAVRLDPSFCLLYFCMGLAYEALGELPRAMALVQHAMDLSPDALPGIAALARMSASAGAYATARALLDTLLEHEARGRYITSYQLAKIYLALGDVPAALTRLEQAFSDRAYALAYMHLDSQLRLLDAEPRFRQLVERSRQTVGSAA